MKNAKSNSLRTQRAIATFGKAARHPFCQAWLGLRRWQSDCSKYEAKAAESLRLLKEAEQQKKRTCALYEQFQKEGKQKEAIEAVALLRGINGLLEKIKTSNQAHIELCAQSKEFCQQSDILFVLERQMAEDTKDTGAFRALKHLKATASKPMSVSQKRVLGILKMLQDKIVTATSAKEGKGAVVAYIYTALLNNRPLSDEFWQGRCTVLEFRSGLEAMYGPKLAGDKDGKEVRRTLKGLGIQPAKDQVGRKWKPPLLKEPKPKRLRGRPREKPELMYTGNVAGLETAVAKKYLDPHRVDLKAAAEKDAITVAWAKSELAKIDREIRTLTLLRGGTKGLYEY